MTGKTHMAVGAAAALALSSPAASGSLLVAALGGLIGGYLPDMDIRLNTRKRHPFIERMAWLGMAAVLILADLLTGAGMCEAIARQPGLRLLAGTLGITVLILLGARSGHRGLTHSLLALALTTLCCHIFWPPFALPVAAGYLSHLVLDLLNRKPLRLMYPIKKGCAMGLANDHGLCDRLLACVGVLTCIGFCVRILR